MTGTGRRGHSRAQNRHQPDVAEEAEHWARAQTGIRQLVDEFNIDNERLEKLKELDKDVGALEPEDVSDSKRIKMENMCRTGVKDMDKLVVNIRDQIDKLRILREVLPDPAEASRSAGPGKRGATRSETAAAASALYDFDGSGDSPAPSPAGNAKRKASERAGTRDRERDRSIQRGSTPPKADSVEPQPTGASTPAAGPSGSGGNKSKVIFAKGGEVAFKPKLSGGDAPSDWILGEVAQVLGEGKSRRYKVIDVEPDDQSKQKEYRTSASSMIPITPESQAASLPEWEPKMVVLALYPNTTTFYKAEVHSADDGGRVNLKFEGENDSSTLQQVERRYVIEYRA
ncbi:hypothetical protein N3K66_005181 [Trichothecium roseum]|uniref:Uncharacterized protein n=1 Tax=Trichothecium roseum TaxID=47278 RepID=A0ACC0V4U0_9HYPO|nr:hypothetical protein N3K66_005181 [Trichothecium roseum]